MYDAKHEIFPVKNNSKKTDKFVGPICNPRHIPKNILHRI